MESSIIKDNPNPLLHRREVLVEISFKGATPSRDKIREAIVAKLGSNPKLTVVKKIKQEAGMHRVVVLAYVYNSEEAIKRLEPLYVLKRNGLIEGEGEKAS